MNPSATAIPAAVNLQLAAELVGSPVEIREAAAGLMTGEPDPVVSDFDSEAVSGHA